MTDKPNCPDFILAETTDGLVLSYCGDEFTIDDEMRKDLREYLMKDVIKELEQRAINYAEQSDDADASRDLQIGFVGKSMGLRQAISLIRGDGK